MSAFDLVTTVLGTTLGDRLPELVDRALAAELIEEFKLGPIFPLGSPRAPRIALSNQGEPVRWRNAVLGAFAHPKLERFLDSVPPSARRMVDTDGDSTIVYLDDLQDVEGGLVDASGRALMFLTLDTVSGRLGSGTRHTEPPQELLDGVLAERLTELVRLGAAGLWSIRWEAKRAVGLVWVSESRWRKNAGSAAELLRALGTHPGIEECARAASAAGYLAYPDAIEVRDDGSWDVTLGFVHR